jgi:gluconate 2-dehydrogenase alpha chain
MTNLKPVDVAIIGGGFTGLLMAKEITAKTPLTVAVFERGGPRKTADYAMDMDEVDYYFRLRMMQNTAEETITHRHSLKNSAVPVRQHGSFLPGTGVGGAAEHWGGASFRFLPSVFTLATHLKERHGAAKLSEDLSVQDWGVTYDELEPLYWKSEQLMGISGKAGNLRGKKIDGGNVFEGMRQQEYPTPPLKQSYVSSMFEETVRKMGYHPYPTPAANLSETYKNPDGVTRPACAYCGHCQRYGCMIGAKAQPTNMFMPVLANRKNFQLRTGSWVRRIVHKDGRATGIQFTDATGEEFFQPASTVLLASFTLNNTRLLALSKIGTPYDPVTRKGTLGRNLTHQVQVNTRLFFDKPLNAFMGAGSLGTRFSDFDGDTSFHGAEDEPLRLGMIAVGSNGEGPIASFGTVPRGASKSNWGSEWKKASLEWKDRSAAIGMAGEHLAYRQNYMDLDPTYTDKFGDPLLRFTLDWTEHEFKQRDYAAQVQAKIAREMGAKFDEGKPSRARYNVITYQSTHVQGGAIMGTSPETSVVNKYLQHWDIPNLFVIGGSAFPQNAAPNPTLTVMALTYLATDAMLNRYFKKPETLA